MRRKKEDSFHVKKDNPFYEMMARAETVDTIIDPFARAVSINAILGEHQAVMSRLVESRRRAITEAHTRGSSYQQLADALGISKTAVAKIDSESLGRQPTGELDDRVAETAPNDPARLRTVSASPHANVGSGSVPAIVQTFQDDEQGYLDWVDAHLNGYVLNCLRSRGRSGFKLHRASCRTIRGTPPRGGPWTGPYIKVCSDSVSELGIWANKQVGVPPSPCGICFPPSITQAYRRDLVAGVLRDAPQ
jgi:hypothetical protein